MNWLSKLFSRDQRRSRRLPSPPILAFYWDGGVSHPHVVPDISHTGIFLRTADRWFPRTMVRVTLQRKTDNPQQSEETITVQCRVVRSAEDGVGMAIMLAEEDKTEYPASLGSLASRKQLNKFLEQVREAAEKINPAESPYLPFPDLAPLPVTAHPEEKPTSDQPSPTDIRQQLNPQDDH